MATGLEIAACDITGTAQVDPNPVLAVSPWRSECSRHKHLDIAINVCKYSSQPGGTCLSPGYTEFTVGKAEVSGPSCRFWRGPDLPPHASSALATLGCRATVWDFSAPCPGWGAQVFSFSGWWRSSCQSCSSNSSYSCSIAWERGEISKQLGHHFFVWRWIEDPVGLGLVLIWLFWFVLGFFLLFGWCRFWFCCFLENLVLFSLSLLSLRCQECKLWSFLAFLKDKWEV